jgi:hypothetical protein
MAPEPTKPITLEEIQQWSLYFSAVFTDESGSPICSICNSWMHIADGLEPSPACNACVQQFIDQQLPRLLKLAREAVVGDRLNAIFEAVLKSSGRSSLREINGFGEHVVWLPNPIGAVRGRGRTYLEAIENALGQV